MDAELDKFENKYIPLNLFTLENKTILLYAITLFVFPMIFTQQLIVGSIVNALLINSAITLNSKKVFILALIPSIATVTGGVLFGALSMQIVYLLPFIWIANSALMYFVRKLFLKKKLSYKKSITISAPIKVLILSIASISLFVLGVVPFEFVLMFSALQIITIILGAVLVATKNVFKNKVTNWI